VALDVDGEPLTYAALNARANQLARLLRTYGVGPETVVGVCMRHSAELVVAVLAIAKAGATYAGLDTGWPALRIAEAVDDAAATVVIAEAADSAVWPSAGRR